MHPRAKRVRSSARRPGYRAHRHRKRSWHCRHPHLSRVVHGRGFWVDHCTRCGADVLMHLPPSVAGTVVRLHR